MLFIELCLQKNDRPNHIAKANKFLRMNSKKPLEWFSENSQPNLFPIAKKHKITFALKSIE
jgi:hypothetical protein